LSLFLEIIGPLFIFQTTEHIAEVGNEDIGQHNGHDDCPEDNGDGRVGVSLEVVASDSPEETEHVRVRQTLLQRTLRVQEHHQGSSPQEEVNQDEHEGFQLEQNSFDHTHDTREGVEHSQVGEGPEQNQDQKNRPHDLLSFDECRVVEESKVNQQIDGNQIVNNIPKIFQISRS
jgi:hypothetical protein